MEGRKEGKGLSYEGYRPKRGGEESPVELFLALARVMLDVYVWGILSAA
jgi:hypothetical protein